MSNPTELPDLDRLEALARAATPGPWMRLWGERTVYARMEDGCRGNAIVRADMGYSAAEAGNLDFIAAANPAAVLALISLARRAQPEGEARREYTEAVAREAWAVVCNNSKGMPDNMQAAIRDALLAPLYSHSPAAKPEGEAPQADYEDYYLGIQQALEMNENMSKYGTIDKPAAQHAESGAHTLMVEALESCHSRTWKDVDSDWVRSLHYDEDKVRAALAAQSQGAPVNSVALNLEAQLRAVVRERDELRTAIAAKAEAPALDDGEVARLRRVVRALGMEKDIPTDDATLRGCLFSVLGMIALKLERAQQAAAPGALEKLARALAAKWHKDAVDTGFATSEAAVELLEVLDAAPSAPGTPEAPDLFNFDELADACVAVEIPDSQYESLCIALGRAAQLDGGQGEGESNG